MEKLVRALNILSVADNNKDKTITVRVIKHIVQLQQDNKNDGTDINIHFYFVGVGKTAILLQK